MKTGQTTLFIILGILLIFLIGLFVLYSTTYREKTVFESLSLPLEVQEIDTQIDTCFKERIYNHLLMLGQYGGDIDSEKVYLMNTSSFNISTSYTYLSKDGENFLSPLSEIEENFAASLGLFTCFEDVEAPEFSEVDVQLRETVTVTVMNSAFISFENSTYSLTPVREYSIDLNFAGIHNITETILNQDPSTIDFSLLLESGYMVYVLRPENRTIIYVIEDQNFFLNEEPYKFMFVVDLR